MIIRHIVNGFVSEDSMQDSNLKPATIATDDDF